MKKNKNVHSKSRLKIKELIVSYNNLKVANHTHFSDILGPQLDSNSSQ
jgi:hypothetical protein